MCIRATGVRVEDPVCGVDHGDVEDGVGVCARRDDDGVVVGGQPVERDVDADVHPAVDPDVRPVEHDVERVDDPLDRRVVGRDAVADQPVGGGQPLEEVDSGPGGLRPEHVCRVDPGRAGADHGDVQTTVLRDGQAWCGVEHGELPGSRTRST